MPDKKHQRIGALSHRDATHSRRTEYARFSYASNRAGRLGSVSLFPYSSFTNCACDEVSLVTPMRGDAFKTICDIARVLIVGDEDFTNSE